jgi:ferric-dicitrate binding protein FerR (iron transport regulator)
MTVAILFIAALLQVRAEPAARISNVEGGIELGDAAVVARVGDLVLGGDRLRTLKGSSLSLAMESGLILELREDTRFEMKNVNGEPIAQLTEGSVNVKSAGKPVRIETKYGQIIGTQDSQEFDVSYRGDVVQVLVIRGSVRAELSDPLKVVFKNASDLGTRVYQAGSISPTVPREASETTVIVYPSVESPAPRGRRTVPVTPPFPPK